MELEDRVVAAATGERRPRASGREGRNTHSCRILWRFNQNYTRYLIFWIFHPSNDTYDASAGPADVITCRKGAAPANFGAVQTLPPMRRRFSGSWQARRLSLVLSLRARQSARTHGAALSEGTLQITRTNAQDM